MNYRVIKLFPGCSYQLGDVVTFQDDTGEKYPDIFERIYQIGDIVVVTERYQQNTAIVGLVGKLTNQDISSRVPYEVEHSWCKNVRSATKEEIEEYHRRKRYGDYNIGDWVKFQYHSEPRKIKSLFPTFEWYNHKDSGKNFKSSPEDYRHATKKEIEDYLIAEAKKRGYVTGATIDPENEWVIDATGGYEYEEKDDSLFAMRMTSGAKYKNCCVYQNGKWIPIVQKKPSFKVGDWVIIQGNEEIGSSDGRKYKGEVIRIGKIVRKSEASYAREDFIGDYMSSNSLLTSQTGIYLSEIRFATREEIENHLMKEVKHRGYRTGVVITSFSLRNDWVIDASKGFRYYYDEDEFVALNSRGSNNCAIYRKGEWAEIVDKFTIGAHKVEVDNSEIRIGCQTFTPEEIENLNSLITRFHINVFTAHGFYITSDMVERVLKIIKSKQK